MVLGVSTAAPFASPSLLKEAAAQDGKTVMSVVRMVSVAKVLLASALHRFKTHAGPPGCELRVRRAAQRRLATFNLHLVPVLPPGLQHRFGSELLDANSDDRRGLRAATTVPPEAWWLAHVGRPRLRRRHRESGNGLPPRCRLTQTFDFRSTSSSGTTRTAWAAPGRRSV